MVQGLILRWRVTMTGGASWLAASWILWGILWCLKLFYVFAQVLPVLQRTGVGCCHRDVITTGALFRDVFFSRVLIGVAILALFSSFHLADYAFHMARLLAPAGSSLHLHHPMMWWTEVLVLILTFYVVDQSTKASLEARTATWWVRILSLTLNLFPSSLTFWSLRLLWVPLAVRVGFQCGQHTTESL